jgi:hypothetical protein
LDDLRVTHARTLGGARSLKLRALPAEIREMSAQTGCYIPTGATGIPAYAPNERERERIFSLRIVCKTALVITIYIFQKDKFFLERAIKNLAQHLMNYAESARFMVAPNHECKLHCLHNDLLLICIANSLQLELQVALHTQK